MKVRGSNGKWTGVAFRVEGIGEVVVGYDDQPNGTPGDMGNEFIKDCEVLLEDGNWKNMNQAFKDMDIVTDDYDVNIMYANKFCAQCGKPLPEQSVNSMNRKFCSENCKEQFIEKVAANCGL
jgi:hypothetical protein